MRVHIFSELSLLSKLTTDFKESWSLLSESETPHHLLLQYTGD
jgi:hypothetical protein